MEPTEEDMEWMLTRAQELAKARLRECGARAVLCDAEIQSIAHQAAEDGEKRARQRVLDLEDQARAKERAYEAELRRTGKPTLKATFGDLLRARSTR